MLKNSDFMLLLISFSLQVGLSWAVASVIGQILQPCGYSDNLVGRALFLSTVSGAVGSYLLALVLRTNHHKYFLIYKVLMIVTAVGVLLCFGFNRPNEDALLILCWMFYGFNTGPLTSTSLELAAEMTYPIPADNSATLLFTVAIGVYFACALVLTPLLELSTSCSSVVTPASISICLFSIAASMAAIPMKPLFQRKDIAATALAQRNMTVYI